MSDPFIAEIRMFAGNFAPSGWAYCDGQLLSVSQNTALFSLVGTIYGGDGRTTFGLPDTRGRSPVGPRQGPGLSNRSLGQKGGSQDVTSVVGHTHAVAVPIVQGEAQSADPENNFSAHLEEPDKAYSPPPGNATMGQFNTGSTGSTVNDSNMHPYIALNFIIALLGTYPSRS